MHDYQFKHIWQYYCRERQIAYARGNIEQGKQMDKYAMIYFAYLIDDSNYKELT